MVESIIKSNIWIFRITLCSLNAQSLAFSHFLPLSFFLLSTRSLTLTVSTHTHPYLHFFICIQYLLFSPVSLALSLRETERLSVSLFLSLLRPVSLSPKFQSLSSLIPFPLLFSLKTAHKGLHRSFYFFVTKIEIRINLLQRPLTMIVIGKIRQRMGHSNNFKYQYEQYCKGLKKVIISRDSRRGKKVS